MFWRAASLLSKPAAENGVATACYRESACPHKIGDSPTFFSFFPTCRPCLLQVVYAGITSERRCVMR
jgi:hypothetical protein